MRVERFIRNLMEDSGVPVEKINGMYVEGPDCRVADEFEVEIKGRKAAPAVSRFLAQAPIAIIKPDGKEPVVVLRWGVFIKLLRGYLRG